MKVSYVAWQASAELRRLRSLLWADVVESKLHRLERAFKANFAPNQLRAPAGNPERGQWTNTGGSGNGRVAQMAPRGGGRRRGSEEATPAQQARRELAEARAREALRRVQEIDPTWKPKPSLTAPDSIEGEIARAEAHYT